MKINKNLWKTWNRAKVSIGAAGCFLGCFNTMTQISKNPWKNDEIYENLWKTYIRAKVSIGAAGCLLGCFNIMSQIPENLWKTMKSMEIYENR